MSKKPAENTAKKPAQAPTPPASPKKKLSLDVSDVSEVLERKISP
jgi:proline-rich tail region repeat protein